jgi:xanthine phosphoribosyltransferase
LLELEEKLKEDAVCLPGGIIVVGSFLNHQVDPELAKSIGSAFAKLFESERPTKVLTVETSGIVPAFATALAMNVPLLFARKQKPITMVHPPYMAQAKSHTKGNEVEFYVSAEYLSKEDRVLIIDDFLATAVTVVALCDVVKQSGAKLVGIGAVIEKCYEEGRAKLGEQNVRIETLAKVARLEDGKLIFDH